MEQAPSAALHRGIHSSADVAARYLIDYRREAGLLALDVRGIQRPEDRRATSAVWPLPLVQEDSASP